MSPGEEIQSPFESAEFRLIGLTRLALSAWALFAIYLDPVESGRVFGVTYTILVCYLVYSSIVCVFDFFRAEDLPVRFLHWADVAWYLVLIGVSDGSSSIFYFFFFFAILVASFRLGFSEGARVTLLSAISFTLVGYSTAPAGETFELNRFVLRPGYLLILGYMMAYWGGREILSKKRLALLKDVSRLSNPRFGVDQTVNSVLEQLHAYYGAEVTLLVVRGLNSSPLSIIKLARDEEQNIPLKEVSKADISPLLTLPSEIALAFNGGFGRLERFMGRKNYYALDLKTGQYTDGHLEVAEGIANFLEVESLISIPLRLKGTKIGRLFIGAAGREFSRADIEFILQVSEQVMPVIENVRLLDDLASESAERARAKISRDLHDSTVQPYLGLKFKLEGLLRKLSPEERLYGEVRELVEMVSNSVADLRGYISALRSEPAEREPVLIDAIRRLTQQFTKHHSIEIEVRAPASLPIPDRLAAEVFQMVSEGLSNINRHSKSDRALISLSVRDKSLCLTIENNGPGDGEPAKPFFPRSLAGRAKALGGNLTVRQNGKTSVAIKIPI